MQPWKISDGLTAALAGSAVLLARSRLEYLAPFWFVTFADYGLAIALHLALAAVSAALYGLARAAGLADLGRRVDFVERSVPRGEGDPELARALNEGHRGRLGLTPSRLKASGCLVLLGPRGPGSCRPAVIHNTTTRRF